MKNVALSRAVTITSTAVSVAPKAISLSKRLPIRLALAMDQFYGGIGPVKGNVGLGFLNSVRVGTLKMIEEGLGKTDEGWWVLY